ncbi:hypothetical protein [Salipiger aestuarii]|uniref:Uncharacterized protein n=1 Tax=Salipiger aestuarii TaxID=568098 RepID=A0A327Y863_9RHOB|nr:hypothetical protein [Salipiger aestuarii]RAK17230.1 hypothetical protein ATI53_101528 [Salipiger aestuarii]
MKDGWTMILAAVGIIVALPILAFGGGGDSGQGLFDRRVDPPDLSALPDRAYAPQDPDQVTIASGPRTDINGFETVAVARFRMQGLVLSRKDYKRDHASGYSPVDLGLGWGRLSNPRIAALMTFAQGNRQMRYSLPDGDMIPQSEIGASLTNAHLVPAGPEQKRALDRVRRGDVVHIEGYLVNVTSPDGTARWVTSRSRYDTGYNACEIILVQRIRSYTPGA